MRSTRSRLQKTGRDRLGVVRAVLLLQLVGCLLLSVLGLFVGKIAAWSVLAGGLICVIPNAYFAWRAFRYRGARAAREILRSFYQGEAVKFVLTAVLFALVFVWLKPLSPLALFVGFIGTQIFGWVGSLAYSLVYSGRTESG